MKISSINGQEYRYAPITLKPEVQIRHIDNKIKVEENNLARIEKDMKLTKELMQANRDLYFSNKELIKLHQEQKQIILEQKENNNKIIANNNKAISQLKDLLDGKKPVRSKSVQPVQTSKLEEVNTLPKGALISEQKAKLESDVKKYNIAIDYHNNKLDKLNNTDKAKDVAATTKPSKREGLATGYKPTNPIPTLKAENKPDIVKSSSSYISNFSSQQQRYIAQSQANIWDSIIAANIRKLI